MSDQRLRELQRDAASGDPEAQVRLLRALARAGELSAEEAALGEHLRAGPGGSDAVRWFEGLNRWGPQVLQRARLACSRRLLGEVEGASDPRLVGLLHAMQEQVDCPCRRHRRRLIRAIQTASELMDYSLLARRPNAKRARPILESVFFSACAIADHHPEQFCWEHSDNTITTYVVRCLHVLSVEQLHDLVREALLPRLLDGQQDGA